ncbi:MAG: radical SAM protein [Halobacteriota archaeon]|nr:radical SAM protein [Halobacteriota archaeon]
MNKITFYMDEVENILNEKHQPPICAEVDPSNYCNNNCSFCCFAKFLKSHREHLPMYLYDKFLNGFCAVGGKAITFTGGGEPLMNPKFLTFAHKAHRRGIKLGLVTNGILLHNIRGSENLFRFIRVSLNASNSDIYYTVHETKFFDQVVRNIRYITNLKDRPDIGLSFVVCNHNRGYENETVALGEDLGVDYVQIKPDIYNDRNLSDVGGSSEGIKITCPLHSAKRFGKLPCAIAGLTFILNATGDVFYCCVQRGNDDFKLGSIRNFDVSDFVQIREQFKPNLSKCTTCRYTAYAEHYERYKGSEYIFLRHKEFL